MLVHDLAGALPELRAHAESRMTSTARIRRETAKPVTVDGMLVPGWSDVHATLPGRLAATRGAGQSRTVSVDGTDVQVAAREWHCPAGTQGIRDGDVLEVTDGENAGLFLRVVESTGQDQATALRLPVVEVEEPAGWSA